MSAHLFAHRTGPRARDRDRIPARALAVALLGLGALAASAGAGEPPPWRRGDLVTVSGADLAALEGARPGTLALLAYGDGAPRPVPFQIDERGPDGSWVMTHGLEAGRDVDDGALDPDDELAFMYADAGARAPGLPGWASRGAEIEVLDPLDGERAWVYLVEGADPPRSHDRYVRLDPETDSIESDRYGLTFSHAVPLSLAFLALKDRAGAVGPNLIDRIKVRVDAQFLVGLIDVSFTEEDIRSVPVGYRDGPVRVIRRLESTFPGVLGLKEAVTFAADQHYGRNGAVIPIRFELPFEIGLAFSDLVLDAYVDFRAVPGLRVSTERGGAPLVVDGTTSDGEREVPPGDPGWLVSTLGPDLFAARIFLDPRLESVHRDLYYVDDATRSDPPEARVGLVPGLGLRFTHFDEIPRGVYDTRVELHFLEGQADHDPTPLFRARDAPLEVRARPLLDGAP